jgi:hypothetical protein
MGMYDESWCASCGAGMHYTADESAECGECASDQAQDVTTRSSKFIEYMKLHLISLNQDMQEHSNFETKIHLNGQIVATRHLLSVATDIMNNSNEREYE